ncbi:MAG TPA: helix-turn-helix transcriptional regulator [Candidatus Kapabacteria bacterium]|nr:helix-turn-helix transcriptional regulator [Candidatus Kapabacteria bacterium]
MVNPIPVVGSDSSKPAFPSLDFFQGVRDSEELRGAIDYICSAIGAKLTLESVAAHLNLTPRSLERMFHHHTGMPVHHFIIEYRMREAKRMIQETNIEISEIAITLGYPDAQSFSRAVKKRYGYPPKELKRILKEKPKDA